MKAILLFALLFYAVEAEALIWLNFKDNLWYGTICRNGKFWERLSLRDSKPISSTCTLHSYYEGIPFVIDGWITRE